MNQQPEFVEWPMAMLEAMAEQVLPGDSESPGAQDAGVAHYIVAQLNGDWGFGRPMYLKPPFAEPDHTGHGWQWSITPRQLYSMALEGMQAHCRKIYGQAFERLETEEQQKLLEDLEKDEFPPFGVVPSAAFFELFRANVIEGMFCDPAYGGNQDLVGWRWIGFSGQPLSQPRN